MLTIWQVDIIAGWCAPMLRTWHDGYMAGSQVDNMTLLAVWQAVSLAGRQHDRLVMCHDVNMSCW